MRRIFWGGLVGIVVYQAAISVFGGHAGAFIHVAIVRVVHLAERVAITNVPVIHELRVSISDSRQIGVRYFHVFELDGQRQFNGWEHCNESGNTRLGVWLTTDSSIYGEGSICSNNVCAYGGKSNFVSRRRPVILTNHFDGHFFDNAKIFQISRYDTNISAQLPLLSVLHDSNLILTSSDLISAITGLLRTRYEKASSKRDIESDADGYTNFNPKYYVFSSFLLFVGFVILFGKGFKRFVEGPGFLCGAAMMLVGWLTGLAAVVLFISWILGHFWLSENVDVSSVSDASATRYSRTENVGVFPIVVSELKLGNVQRHVFGANFVECADNAALNQRPKTLNRVGVNRADDIFLRPMANETMRIFFTKPVIGAEIVSRQQTDFVGNCLMNEADQRFAVEAIEDAGDNLALPLDSADDADLAGAGTASTTAPLIPMLILVLPADVGFVNLDNTAQLVGPMLTEASANAVAHVERGFIRTEAHIPHDLQRTHALFANQHKVHDLEPVTERLVGVLKDRPDQNRKPIATRLGAFGALPVKGTIGDGIHVHIATAGAVDTFGPAAGNEVSFASILVREHIVKLLICKLFYRLDAGHFGLPYPVKRIWHA